MMRCPSQVEFNDGQLDKLESTMWTRSRSAGWKGFAEAQLARGDTRFCDGSEPASVVTGQQPAYAANPENNSSQDGPNARSQSDSTIFVTVRRNGQFLQPEGFFQEQDCLWDAQPGRIAIGPHIMERAAVDFIPIYFCGEKQEDWLSWPARLRHSGFWFQREP